MSTLTVASYTTASDHAPVSDHSTAPSVTLTGHLGHRWGIGVAGLDILNRAAVAALIGVDPGTITRYLNASRPGGRYEDHPFPEPTRVDGRPYWRSSQADEIKAWDEGRPGRGVGGGAPAHKNRA